MFRIPVRAQLQEAVAWLHGLALSPPSAYRYEAPLSFAAMVAAMLVTAAIAFRGDWICTRLPYHGTATMLQVLLWFTCPPLLLPPNRSGGQSNQSNFTLAGKVVLLAVAIAVLLSEYLGLRRCAAAGTAPPAVASTTSTSTRVEPLSILLLEIIHVSFAVLTIVVNVANALGCRNWYSDNAWPLPANPSPLSASDLGRIAALMERPKRCCACGFGPVEHAGCSDLRTHHGQPLLGGVGRPSTVSNACPHCGFVGSDAMRDWAKWPGLTLFTLDDVYVVQAAGVCAARACIFALAISLASNNVSLDVSVISWAAASTCYATLALIALCLKGAVNLLWLLLAKVSGQPEHVAFATAPRFPDIRGEAGGRVAWGGNSAALDDVAPSDCGGPRRDVPLGRIDVVTALTNAFSARPAVVFLARGGVCPACLDVFEGAAYDAPQKLRGSSATEGGAATPLWCGHVVHAACLRDLVYAGEGQHVLCPLCRVPVTTAACTATAAQVPQFSN
jgi:ribosomal protein L37E